MKKTIDFIELSKLVKDGKQPKRVLVKIEQLKSDDYIPYEWKEWDYVEKDNGIFLTTKYPLFDLVDLEFIYEEPVLTDKEREYLSAVIKPWKEKVEHICKYYSPFIRKERIVIDLEDDLQAYLPYFETGKYYEGMKLDKKYTLEEIGL